MATRSSLTSVSSGEIIYADASTVTFRFYIRVYDASYTHTLRIKRDSTTILTLSLGAFSVGDVIKSVSLTSAQRTTLLNAMTDVARFNATYELTTLDNGSTVGTSEYHNYISVSSVSYPVVNAFTYADTNADTVALTGNNQVLVANASTITFSNMSATAKNGATLSSFTIWTSNSAVVARNISPSTTSYAYGLYKPGTVSDSDKLYLQATDSRGISQSYGIDVEVVPYYAPSFTEYSIKRNGTDRTKANFVFSGTFATVLSNTVTLKYRYKEVGGSFGAYTTPTLTINNGTFSYTATGIGSFDVEKNYEFEVVLTDILKSNTVSILLPTRDVLLSFRENALGIGKVPNGDHVVDIADNYSLISTMPYVFSTNGGQTFSSFSYTPGYARIARVTFTSAPAQQLGPSSGVIRFRIESSRQTEAQLTMMFNMYPANVSDMNLGSFYRLYYAQTPGNSYGDSSFFVQLVSAGTYDFYVQLNDTYDKLTVCTYIQELLKEYVQVTYEDAYIATSSAPAASSTVKYGVEQGFNRLTANSTFTANGKNNTFAYMPYSWSTYANSGTQCYVRIATVTVTGTYSTAPITFVTTRTADTAPVVLHMAFPGENTTDPSTCYLRYNDVNGAYTANGQWSAFAVKLSTSTWGVYIWKSTSSGVVGVTTYLSAYTQGKVTITYSDDSYTSIPSGAIMATPMPYTLGYNNAKTLMFNIASGSSVTIKGSSECAWLLGCTGWNSTMRRGLWWISGYSDSSRADVIYMLGNYSNSQISITAVSGQLAWTISNTGTTTALMSCLALYGALPTVS